VKKLNPKASQLRRGPIQSAVFGARGGIGTGA
jgi:hypothetical protein